MRLVSGHKMPRALDGRKRKVVRVRLDVARALLAGAIEVWGPPRLLERWIEHKTLAVERADAKVPSSIASHAPSTGK